MNAIAAVQPVRTHHQRFPWAALAAALVLSALAYGPGLRAMLGRWLSGGDYAHAPLVLLAAGWVVWTQRERLRSIPRGSSVWGLPFAAFAALLLGVGLLEGLTTLETFACAFGLLGIALVFLGLRLVRALWFFVCLLFLAIPLPHNVLGKLTFELQMLTAQLSLAVLHLTGQTAELVGSTLHLNDATVAVGEACSGLHTLVALVTLSIFMAYRQRARWKAVAMLALAAPIAVAANAVRVLVLCPLAVAGSPAATEGPLHEATGLAVYGVALLLLLGVQALPERRAGASTAATAQPTLAARATPAPGHRSPGPLLLAALLLLLGLQAAAAITVGPSSLDAPAKAALRTPSIPARLGEWAGRDQPLDPATSPVLGTDDVLRRRYTRAGSYAPVSLYVASAAGDALRIAHPPEWCLRAAGYEEQERSLVVLPVGDSQVPCNRLVYRIGEWVVLVYYWFRFNDQETPSYADYLLDCGVSSVIQRLQGADRTNVGSLIRVTTDVGPDGLDAAERRVATFAAEFLGEGLAGLR